MASFALVWKTFGKSQSRLLTWSTRLVTFNAIPEGFPEALLKDLCGALVGLPDGTAENCRTQLELTRTVLPKIRREYFALEEGEEKEEEPKEPRFYRGMLLDQKLNLLLASVTTALDEYRAQAQERFDDEIRAEEIALIEDKRALTNVFEGTTELVGSVNSSIDELDEKGVSESEGGDILRRRLKDSENLALAARSQLQIQPIIRRWFESVSGARRKTPALIGMAGRALRLGAEISQPLADWWAKFEKDSVNTIIKKIREVDVIFDLNGTWPVGPVLGVMRTSGRRHDVSA